MRELAVIASYLPGMEGFPRDLLCGIGRGGDGPRREVRPRLDVEAEEVELNLGLSLGGRFGLERRGEKLARSSSVAAILAAPDEVAPPALFRTSSLPTVAAAEAAKKQGLDDLSCCRPSGGVEAEPAARLLASGSPSSGSSDGEGRRLEDTNCLGECYEICTSSVEMHIGKCEIALPYVMHLTSWW